MQRLIHTVALLAALVAVFVALGRDYSLLVALKRAVVSYLAFFFVVSILALIYRVGVLAETRKAKEPAEDEEGQEAGVESA